MDDTKQFKKNFIWNILGTGLNAFNSLFFLITVTRINGLSDAGIFTIAYSTACIIYVFGIYAGRIYQVTEPDKKVLNIDYVVNRVITVLLMSFFVIIFSLVRGYDNYKTLVFFLLTLYKSLEAFSEVIYGILQKNGKLEFVGKSLFMKASISVIIFMIADIVTKNMMISILFMIFVWLILFWVYDFVKVKDYLDFNEKCKKENVLSIFKNGFTTFAIAFLGLYIINAPKYAIDNYLPNSIQTIFGIVVMPATVIGLLAQFLIHPFLNQILKYYKDRDLQNLNKIIIKLILIIVGFGTLCAIVAYLIGTQVLGFVYGLDLSAYKLSLFIIIFASTLYTVGTIYSSVLTTVRETFSQFIIYMIIAFFGLVISNLLTKNWEFNGAVFAYLAIMTMQFLIYIIYTNIRLKVIFKKGKTNE